MTEESEDLISLAEFDVAFKLALEAFGDTTAGQAEVVAFKSIACYR